MTIPTPPDSAVLTLPEVARLLRCHKSTVYRLLHGRKLPGFQIGHIWRFRRQDIDAWRFRPAATKETT